MPSSPLRVREGGLTLIELVVVLGLVASLAALLTPRLGGADNTLTAQAYRLARDLRHAQALAANQGRTLRFDVESVTSYRVTFGGSTIDDPATGRPFAVTLADPVTLSGIDTEIDSMGRPVAGGVLLTAERVFDLGGAARTVAVTMSPVTGFVELSP